MKTTQLKSSAPSPNFNRVYIATGLILAVPLIAMQFTSDVNWGLGDFIVMGALLAGAGMAYELLASKLHNPAHRWLLGFGVLTMVLLIWAELAVDLVSQLFTIA